MTIETELSEAGFELVGTRGRAQRFARRTHPYLQWWVVLHADGTAEVQWELELGEYLLSKGFHVSVQDELSLLLFPRAEMRGPADARWIASQIEEAEARLRAVNLATGE
jgi:hypothetical protein